VNPGTHINAIGADAKGKEELDPSLLKRAKIVVDDYEQATHSGEVNVPISQGIISTEDIYAELGEITIGDIEGRTSEEEITIFDSTGLAIQDTITAYIVFKKIQAQKLGTMIDLKF
jgi:alanine dehydrogenase